MTIYYISIVASQFFFTTDHIQTERSDQYVDPDFVPVTNYLHTHRDVREYLLADGYTEIENPDPAFAPVIIFGLLAEAI